ncbi:MAG: TraR/DksA C4-type zinc finger protein [Acidimicrobiia bacterium]|nr:TraR/DksA C4-type zinc finger protein [Acidimicrobiia bacterium]
MTQDPWDFLPDDDRDDNGLDNDGLGDAEPPDGGPEAAALHVTDDPDAELDEGEPTPQPPTSDQRGYDDEEPDATPQLFGFDESADVDGDIGEELEESDGAAEDVESLLERQHYAFPGDDTDDAAATHHTNGNGRIGKRATPQITADRLRGLLEAEQQRLRQLHAAMERDGVHAAGVSDDLGDLSHAHQHAADLGTETYEREVELSLAHEIEDELREVDRALSRLADGHFGLCEACGAAIDPARLEALPATRWCVAHAADRSATAAPR